MEENYQVWEIAQHLLSQSRVGGMGGFIGFDYGCLQLLLVAYDVPPQEWRFILDKLQILSSIAIRLWNKSDKT